MLGPSQRYLASNFPCRAACPVGTNAGGYVSLIAQGRHRDAYALARGPNPFASVCGRICAHPCEAACRRGAIDAPISIRALKRTLCERFGPESERSFAEILELVEKPRPRLPEGKGKRVGVIGAGPGGLACAHDLALMGHRVTVYEKAEKPGGMLRAGIPEYRLPREVIDSEIDFIRFLGVEIRCGFEVGRDASFAALAVGHDALFLAPGCGRGKALRIPGVELDGVVTAVDFLAHVNLGVPLPPLGERVLVVGGGNVAYDVARSARRYGGTSLPDEEHHNLALDAAVAASRLLRRQVTMVALEGRDEMPADAREIEEGSEEGIRLVNRRGPKAILGDERGRVRALETLAVARVFDEAGRFAPVTVPGSESELACDTLILAVGQLADLSFLGEAHGLELTPQHTIQVDRQTLATSRPGVYAGGDCAFGPRIVIEAVGDGRRAARAIDSYLSGRVDPAPRYRTRVFETFGYDHPFAVGDYERVPRMPIPLIPVERRLEGHEVERVMDEREARVEGERCLHCWVNTIFDSSKLEGSECLQCGGCVDVCPEQCIDLVALTRIAARGGEPQLLPDGSPLRFLEGASPGAALVKDETACIRCGLCARRCPAGTITMQAFYPEGELERMRHAEGVL